MSAPMFPTRKSERIIRRLLFLPAEQPNFTGTIRAPEKDSPGAIAMDWLPKDEKALEVLRWHEEGWRGTIAEKIHRVKYAPTRTKQLLDRIRANHEYKKATKLLSDARVLTFTSSYVHRETGETGVEGYFDFGNDICFGLTILSANAMQEYAKMEWDRLNGIVDSDNTLIFGSGENWLVVPDNELNEDNVREGILRWYQQRYSFVRGHWSQLEKSKPQIILNLSWEDEETYNAY